MVSGPTASVDGVHLNNAVSSNTDLLQQAEEQQVCSGETDRKQADRSPHLESPRPRLFALRRCGAQFLNPSLLGFVLIRPLPDERSQPVVIIGSKRYEAERLQC